MTKRYTDPHGYVWIKPPGQPWIKEHRYIMSQVIGRPLLKSEHVHHKNHIKDDNRPENLELVTMAEHAKIHIADYTRDAPNKIGLVATDENGVIVKNYVSYAEARRDGHNPQYIQRCVRVPNRSYHGLYWRQTTEAVDQSAHAIVAIKPDTKEIVGIYRSGKEAQRVAGTNIWDILKCCRHKNKTHNGIIYRFIDDLEDLDVKIPITGYEAYNRKPIPVVAYDLYTLKPVAVFDDINDVVKYNPSFVTSDIRRVCSGERRQSHGYIWCYKDDAPNPEHRQSVIAVFDKDTGDMLEVYESAAEAGKQHEYNTRSVHICLEGKLKTYRKKLWRFVDANTIPDDMPPDKIHIYRQPLYNSDHACGGLDFTPSATAPES